MSGSKAEGVTFGEALARSGGQRRHLLLGNGFSLSLHNAFGYPALFEEAVQQDPSLRTLFAPGQTNCEVALAACADPADARRIRRGLIKAVSAVHPQNSLNLTEPQCRSCWDFLAHFVGRERSGLGTIHTTNYDLLLHWVLSRQGKRPGTKQYSPLRCRDGFTPDGEWSPREVASHVFYLHGAVHIFQRPHPYLAGQTATGMLRYTFGRRLTKQVELKIAAGEYPVFIAEGSCEAKRRRIRQLKYLRDAHHQFRAVLRNPSNALFTFGHSFGASDDHIAKHIADGTVGDVYIAAYSDEDERRACELSDLWNEARVLHERPPVRVRYFHPSECAVWSRYDAAAA